MKFDPIASELAFSTKDNDELIRIAYLEDTYVSEAKELAKSMLAKRGIPTVNDADIERVRKELEERADALREHNLRNIESDAEIPNWRRAIRKKIAPHRGFFSVLAWILMIFFWLNSWFEWKVINIGSRRSQSLATLVGLVWILFVLSSREEMKEQRKKNKNSL